MGRKPSTEKKKKGPKRLKKGPKPLKMDDCDQSLRELPPKKKSRDAGNISVIAKIDMKAVTAEDVVTPKTQDGEVILDVECGSNKAILFLSKLCQGSKGPCISFQGTWLTPNEFQFVSGRETAKDWKRSIRHNGKSIKLLMAKDILTITPGNTKSGESIPKKKSKLNLDKKKPSDEKVGNNEMKNDTEGTFTEVENKENVQIENKSCKDTDDLKNETVQSAIDDNKTEESWEGGSDTTEPVDYDFDKCGFDEETSNIISECDAIKAVAKLKTEDVDQAKSKSVVSDEVTQKITPSNPDKTLQKEGNDSERKAQSFDCNHISAKINGGKNESKSETCSSDNKPRDNDVSDETKCFSTEKAKQISAIPVLKIKKRRIAKKNKTKGPDIKHPKSVMTEKIRKRKRKLSVSTPEFAKYTEGEKLASEDGDRGESYGKQADDSLGPSDKNDNSVSANDRISCPRESRLGSIINQLRESKEKRKSDKTDDDVPDGENNTTEKGIKRERNVNIPSITSETKDAENGGKKIGANREKSPRKHNQVKRSPYFMKKEAKQKYLEIFERDTGVSSTPGKDEAPAKNSPENKTHPESRVTKEKESTSVSGPDHTKSLSVTHTEKIDENRNQYKLSNTFSIDSIISSSQTMTNKSPAFESTKKAIPAISIPSTTPSSKITLSEHSPTDYNVFSRSPNSTSPNRTNSPLSRKDHILQRTGSPRNGVRSPQSSHTDHYNEYMKTLAATYSLLPSPAFYDHYFRSPEIPFHPGYVHPYMFPAFTEHSHHLESFAAAARPQTIKSKSVTSPKVASPAVLDLTRLPHNIAPPFHTTNSSTTSPAVSKKAVKRPPVSSESVLDLSVKRPKLHSNSIFDIPKCNIESPFNNNAYRLHQELYGSERSGHLLSDSKHVHLSSGKVSNLNGSSCLCAENSSKDIRNWSVERVGQFLRSLEGCSSYVKVFHESRISGKYLPLLTTDQLVLHLGMKDKPARILCEAVTNKVLELRKYSIPCAYCKTKNDLQSRVCF
ncbi:uncharacterized protein LOC133190313 isoform X1 [Saccostrea echinata]|uniref:uncharacterized protein LOC133190313 isoform X1 n=1 Tax=Saccostrea echinata TaxID=191078 RepID=UPI002A7EB6FE|nr:uncharacterized protein LOC133190313 isoform X1 [Saccostrea echinata]